MVAEQGTRVLCGTISHEKAGGMEEQTGLTMVWSSASSLWAQQAAAVAYGLFCGPGPIMM